MSDKKSKEDNLREKHPHVPMEERWMTPSPFKILHPKRSTGEILIHDEQTGEVEVVGKDDPRHAELWRQLKDNGHIYWEQ